MPPRRIAVPPPPGRAAPRPIPWPRGEKRLHFSDARDGQSPEGRQVAPLGPFDRSRVRKWLEAMDAELAPIRSWLP